MAPGPGPSSPCWLMQDVSEQKLPWREIWNLWASCSMRQDGWPWWEQDAGAGARGSGAAAAAELRESWLDARAARRRPHGNHWQPTA